MPETKGTSRFQVTGGGWWCYREHCAEFGRMTCMTDHPPINCRATKRSGERRKIIPSFMVFGDGLVFTIGELFGPDRRREDRRST
jgi:hypothetical protein